MDIERLKVLAGVNKPVTESEGFNISIIGS